MANLQGALQQLRVERKRAEEEVQKLDHAILAIEGILGRSSGTSRNSGRPGRVVSAAARSRMAQAQRARWARVRQQAGGASKTRATGKRRTLSPAARRKIAAAQRARWARFRAKSEKAAA
jgi:hypothetical protein